MAKPDLKQQSLDQTGSADALKILARLLARDAVRVWLASPTTELAVE